MSVLAHYLKSFTLWEFVKAHWLTAAARGAAIAGLAVPTAGVAQASLAPSAPLHLECEFTGEDPSDMENDGPRRLAFTIEARGSRVTSIALEDPTGVFSSGNIVGFVSAGRSGARYAPVPRDEDARWRGRVENGSIVLTGTRREVSLVADGGNPGRWSGRLRYELGGTRSLMFAKEGPLSCRTAETAAAESPE